MLLIDKILLCICLFVMVVLVYDAILYSFHTFFNNLFVIIAIKVCEDSLISSSY